MTATEVSTNKKKTKIIHIAIWLLFLAVATLLCIVTYRVLYKKGAFLPKWIEWKEISEDYTFIDSPDQNENPDKETKTETAEIKIDNRKFLLSAGGDAVWESEEGWLVSDVIVGDIDHDDEDEVIVLFWRIGSYGHYKPMWVEEDEETWSQHLAIYDYDTGKDERLVSKWTSSKMGIEAKEINLDAKEKLHIVTPEGKETTWYWGEWGLVLVE